MSIKKAFGAIATALLKLSTMKKLILILVVLFSSQINFAQSGSGVIKGLVVDNSIEISNISFTPKDLIYTHHIMTLISQKIF